MIREDVSGHKQRGILFVSGPENDGRAIYLALRLGSVRCRGPHCENRSYRSLAAI